MNDIIARGRRGVASVAGGIRRLAARVAARVRKTIAQIRKAPAKKLDPSPPKD